MKTTETTKPSDRLKLFRTVTGLRVEAIATELNVSSSILKKAESGHKEISQKMADALFKRFKLPIDWLMKGEGEMTFEVDKNDELVNSLKAEIEFYRNLITKAIGSKNFQQALNLTGFKNERLRAA